MGGYNGAGVYQRFRDWTDDRDAGIKIRADYMDIEMDGFAAGLSSAIVRDGQSTVTGNINMNSHKLTNLLAGTVGSQDSMRMDQGLLLGANAAQLLTMSGAGTILTLQSTDPGATSGPDLVLRRFSATPLAQDIGGSILFDFQDSTAVQTTFARIKPVMLVPTNTAEVGALVFGITNAGVLADEWTMTGTAFYPSVDKGSDVGDTTHGIGALYVGAAGFISFGNSDVTLSHSTDALLIGGTANGVTIATGNLILSGTGQSIVMGPSSDVSITHAADQLTVSGLGGNSLVMTSAAFRPGANGTHTLGVSGTAFGGAFFAANAAINFGAGDVTIQHATDALTFTGLGTTTLSMSQTAFRTLANDVATLGDSSNAFSDLYLASGGFVDFANNDVRITHAADSLTFSGIGTNGYLMSQTTFRPTASATATLGVSGTAWSGLFLTGAIDFNAGDVTLTPSADTLTFGTFGTDTFVMAADVFRPGVTDGAALGSTTVAWSDLWLASGGVIDFNNDIKITHSLDKLTFSGATVGAAKGYSFDGHIFLPGVGTMIEFGASDVQIVHSADTLTFSGLGGDAIVMTTNAFKPSVNDTMALGATGTAWSDIYLGSGGIIDWASAAVKLTHITGGLNLDGTFAATVTAAGTAMTLQSNDAGAALGPNLLLFRNSASPFAADLIGSVLFQGKDSVGNTDDYARVKTEIISPTSAAEAGAMYFAVRTAGALTDEVKLTGAVLGPVANDGTALGAAALAWSDLFLASGGFIDFNNNNIRITHSAGLLSISGGLSVSGALAVSTDLTVNGTCILGNAAADPVTIKGVLVTAAISNTWDAATLAAYAQEVLAALPDV